MTKHNADQIELTTSKAAQLLKIEAEECGTTPAAIFATFKRRTYRTMVGWSRETEAAIMAAFEETLVAIIDEAEER